MEQNLQFQQAWDFIENTGHSVFLTGKAGTGKTTFLRTVVKKSSKQSIVLAPTGVAAINAGGVTIHSFFQLPLTPYLPGANVKTMFSLNRNKRKIIASLDMIIIDEISMVRCDVLDAIDAVLRHFRDWRKPFGGVQLLMIGDLAQLTPVVTPEDERMLAGTYSTPYFFGSKALANTDYVTIQFDYIYRQQDTNFINILNRVREGHLSMDELEPLNQRFVPDFQPKEEDGYICLTTHNRMADQQNDTNLQRLPGCEFRYDAEISGDFPEHSYPTAQQLVLKIGAQVMFIRNDSSPLHLYYNGMIGHVVYASNKEIHVLGTGQQEAIVVEKTEWQNERYIVNEQNKEITTEVLGTFKQYPLRLAWAITIHKSQGLTFDRAIIDAASSFTPGQVYVALSRCRSLEGLVLSSKISPSSIINDTVVESYLANQQQQTKQSLAFLPNLKEEYYRTLLIELFDFSALQRLENDVLRLLLEHFSQSFSQLAALHRTTVEELQIKILGVANKWQAQIAMMSIKQLHSEDFLKRVQRSANYFAKVLADILTIPVSLAVSVQTDNKYAMQRMKDVSNDLKAQWRTKVLLLQAMSEKTFCTTTYLDEKRKAVTDAMDEDKSKNSTRKAHEHKQKKSKEPKEKTWEISYHLYHDKGKTIDEIARERGLKDTTIYGHLSRYVHNGMINLTELIDKKKIPIISSAITEARNNNTEDGKPLSLSDIKMLCPEDISYGEIRLILDNIQK